jgi:hypothetical protein
MRLSCGLPSDGSWTSSANEKDAELLIFHEDPQATQKPFSLW